MQDASADYALMRKEENSRLREQHSKRFLCC